MNQSRPEEPNIPRLEGIRDATGENIFSDGEAPDAEEPARDGLLATPVAGDGPVFNPNDFIPTMRSRGKTVFGMSCGVLLVLGGVAAWIGPALGLTQWALLPFLSLSLFTLGVTLCLPAAIMGYNDLKAMRAGAMVNDQLGSTTLGLWLGMTGTLIGVLIGPVSFMWFNWYG
jgi:hypothetical protein